MIAVTCGGTTGESVRVHSTASAFADSVAGGVGFANSRPLTGSWFLTERLTSAATCAELVMVATQCEDPVSSRKEVGAHVCVSDTAPCRLKNATGIVTAL